MNICNDMNEKNWMLRQFIQMGGVYFQRWLQRNKHFKKGWFRSRNKRGTRNWDVKSPPFSMGFVSWKNRGSWLLLRWDGPRTHMLATDPSLLGVKRRDLHRGDSIRKALASLTHPCRSWGRGCTESGLCWLSLSSLACSFDLMLRLSTMGWRGKKSPRQVWTPWYQSPQTLESWESVLWYGWSFRPSLLHHTAHAIQPVLQRGWPTTALEI